MCGIFALLNNKDTKLNINFIKEQSNKASHRGPDNSKTEIRNNDFIAFYRLAINGLDPQSDQPFILNNILLICNGEIYNYKRLYELINVKPISNSDCEIIIHMYQKYGMEYTINALDGVFAFILIDYENNKAFIGRDPYGVRPLFYLSNKEIGESDKWENTILEKNMLGFASEMKQLHQFTQKQSFDYDGTNKLVIQSFSPGTLMTLQLSNDNKWYIEDTQQYTTFNLSRISPADIDIDEKFILNSLHDIFCEAVYKRVQTTDRPIACLLSGGLDSSIVASLVAMMYDKQLETYSIGLEGSEDLKYARIVAKHIESKHTEIVVSEEDFFAFIPTVIKDIESYDTTTIRASVGNLMVAQYISENSNAKVIFNGDGSDELMGGYLYMSHAPDCIEFDKECKRLIKELHKFDVLRSDRSVSSRGLEARTPFLDRDFVAFYLSIPANLRYNKNQKQEKYLFRKAFEREYLPKEILWRKKEAFSDGVSNQTTPWYKIIETMVTNQTDIKYDPNAEYEHNSPQSLEQLYYRTIFEQNYPNQAHLIPHFWMPKYIDAIDSSARSLDIYDNVTPEHANEESEELEVTEMNRE
jgi:asparagine synthase (glutamine-hydrolysing)